MQPDSGGERRQARRPRDDHDRHRRDEAEEEVAPPGDDGEADEDRQPLDPDVERRHVVGADDTITLTAASAARTAGPTSWR